MNKKNLLYRIALRLEHILDILEIILAVTVMAGFAFTFISLLKEMPSLISADNGTAFHEFLEFALTLVVGIEFVKMLIKHTPGSVLEVLLFAIARHLVLSHEDAVGNILSIAAIAGIFAIRKYLHTDTFETKKEGEQLEWLAPPEEDKD